ncbi:facilitated trehalose transporter Tret1-like [Ctenocephalides felis]|uniref:facilitated trehalose transporter Tret1-like n=1 Tax=Ctenocephalides felis TaxID=7515 RepID=UPI000E6E261D|nr:facilitated trehalose transporter Tret1-like [Ctenocephalides felis]
MKKGRFMQYVATICANISSFGIGAAFSWSSPVLARLGNKNYSPFSSPVEPYFAMMLAALVCLGIAIGPFPLAYMAEKIGRKKTILWMAAPTLISWILIVVATSIYQVLVARFLIGLSGSVVFSIVPRYVAEIAEDDNRGGLGSLLQVFVLGMLYSYCVGPFCSYQWFCIACCIIPVVLILTFIWMPESPYYYAAKGNEEGTLKCLMRIRGKTKEEAEREAGQIKSMVQEMSNNAGTYKELFSNKEQRWPLCIMTGLAVSIPLSGATAVQIYAEPIFQRTNTDLSPAFLAIIIGTKLCPSCPLPVHTLVVQQNGQEDPAFDFFCRINHITGFGGITWVIMSEIFPGHLISKAMAVGASTCNFFAFVVSLMFSQVETWLTPGGLFWLFCIFCLLAFVFVLFTVPETRGLSFAQIQEKLKKGRKQRQDSS